MVKSQDYNDRPYAEPKLGIENIFAKQIRRGNNCYKIPSALMNISSLLRLLKDLDGCHDEETCGKVNPISCRS